MLFFAYPDVFFRFGKEERVRMNPFLAVFLAGILFLCFLLLCSEYERKHFKLRRCEIDSDKLPDVFDGYRFVFLSDLHSNSFGKNNEHLIRAIENEAPDAILAGGDMMIGKRKKHITVPVPLRLLRELCKKGYPVYHGLGNHELRMKEEQKYYDYEYAAYQSILELCGVRFLDNETVRIERDGKHILLTCGLTLPRKYYKKLGKEPMEPDFLDQTLGQGSTGDYRILMAHSPLYFPEYVKWGADLVLSGHFHGGTIRLPFLGGLMTPNYMFFPKYDRGRYEFENSVMLLSGGLGTHSINIRLNNRPELYVITLRRKKHGTVL